jgi:hypothetical protein
MTQFDCASEDNGNLVLLEHVNLTIPDQRLATAFYVSGLGLTRDPYLMTGVTNMWINVGRSQIHMPQGDAQRLRGRVGLLLGKRDALIERLCAVRSVLAGTQFGWSECANHVQVTCPWGNRYDCLDPHTGEGRTRWSDVDLGIAYVESEVPEGTAKSIAAFYREMFDARVALRERAGALSAVVEVGQHQELIYIETRGERHPYDGHHIQIYVANFAKQFARLAERGLAYGEEQHQFRVSQLIDLASGARCFELEHEVRSLFHPLYARPLVNRNPEQINRAYVAGGDGRIGRF